jgi:uncharacterized protein (DUF2235 family)
MKSIVVFSDGTGNSAAKFFKTNVYRLYQAVDTSDVSPGDEALRQVVAYDSGVGTSSFKPLALAGGAFGVGLRSNVLDLYRFICRHYEEGDRIYAFGFSRGAFTIRVLVGLIADVGVVRAQDKAVLDALTSDAYRLFRRHFRLSGNRVMLDDAAPRKRRDLTDLLVTPLRNLRDRWVRRGRRRTGLPVLSDEHRVPVKEIEFVGVWDTVAAYGSPIAEITKGIDRWIWPLSMPDYKLSAKVKRARHALALDDERDTFHPLLWDEVHERELIKSGKVAEDRLRQVWFTGMHSDVGGGYSDDSLSYVSLVWMAEEAIDNGRGLRLKKGELEQFRRVANAHGPMHNSRSGLSGYYRYQPRKISARLEKPDPSTLLQQDPDMKGQGLLTQVRIHASVMARIVQGTEHYAPIVLPADYGVVGGPAPEQHASQRAEAQERVWDDVWRRRVNYFLTLFATIWTLLFPFLLRPASQSCVGPECLISPLISYVGGWLPDFTDKLFAGYAARPGVFLISVLAIVLLMRRATRLETSLRDRMHRLFIRSFSDNPRSATDIHAEAGKPGFLRRLRRSGGYQIGLRTIKWRTGPAIVAGVLYLSGLAVVSALLLTTLGFVHRGHMSWAEYKLAYCANARPQAAGNEAASFSTKDMCWRMPFTVDAGRQYRMRLTVRTAWEDKGIRTSPEGFGSERFTWPLRWWAPMLRRSFNDPWFRPLITVENGGSSSGGTLAVPMKLVNEGGAVYSGSFFAPASGNLVLSVNDAVFLWGGDLGYFYSGKEGLNSGTATVELEDCAKTGVIPCD